MAKGYKTGGRQRGTTNKVTKELKELLSELLENEFSSLSEKLNGMETKDRLDFLVKLLPYALPKYEPERFVSLAKEEARYNSFISSYAARLSNKQ
jgi:vacuolar-type H+-ATPase subunit E/Vma4